MDAALDEGVYLMPQTICKSAAAPTLYCISGYLSIRVIVLLHWLCFVAVKLHCHLRYGFFIIIFFFKYVFADCSPGVPFILHQSPGLPERFLPLALTSTIPLCGLNCQFLISFRIRKCFDILVKSRYR